ncbi:hypothetical protein B0O80DRAFT_431561 [Mortierella sp. GBAus27b]|nr:hypothetical protein B0O80DRAFT_431561 [Mortierella sp. GBAus27b]
MAHIPHALSLPEIAFRVAPYLELDAIAACSLVNKAYYASYSPYLWENVHLGVLSSRNRTKHLQQRYIVLEGRPSQRDRILQALPRIAPWIRSLSIYSDFSGGQIMKFGDQCTNLHSLWISPPPFPTQEHEVYWNAYEALVRGNVKGLRSLMLIDWAKYFPNTPQIWGPLHTCARQANLSTLRIQRGTLYEQDWESFWTICRQLEILELTEMDMTALSVPLDESSPEMEPAPHATTTAATTTATLAIAAAVRFPRLRELTLERIQLEPSHQMEHFVLQCPLLHTLVLCEKSQYRYSLSEFCNYLAASTWPYLDSLEITGHYIHVSVEEYALLLQSTQRRFRHLDLYTGAIGQEPFDLLRKGGHFETLTKLDLSIPLLEDDHLPSMVNGVDAAASRRIREVLESCSSLEHFSATTISGQDIIDSQPWISVRDPRHPPI